MVRAWRLIVTMIFLWSAVPAIEAADISEGPSINGRLNDHADILSTTEKNQLYQLLAQFEFAKNYHVVLLTVDSSGDDPVEGYAERIWQGWEPKDKSRAVLLLLSEQQRGGAILVGDKARTLLDTAKVKKVIDENVTANMQQGDYDAAAMGSVIAILGELTR